MDDEHRRVYEYVKELKTERRFGKFEVELFEMRRIMST